MAKKPKAQQQKGPYDEVEFSEELADGADRDAMARMQAADDRAKQKKKKR
ncbi:YfhD family protein [Halalkalibacter oceani]|uniref:YfhD family protein n=1 Tax=Halalkalibacter oceani TaxID=1653776 RepID=A0A9X2DQ20_9BACI|nr:YfhD family protein [Halalkalibacter oceani]MCM3713008.1 YfhD family protein [Halalkalibacter oceani]MCM3759255.1 YfhD family protein [Halalkalibacter oceani]